MYYILNGSNQIIAADETLLNLCGVAHFNELTAKIGEGETLLDSIENAPSFSITKTTLSSTLGDLTLVSLEGDHTEINLGEVSAAVEETELFALLDDSAEEVSPIEDMISVAEEPIETVADDAPLDLGLDLIKEEESVKEAPAAEIEDITINIATLSQNIGISMDDYSTFLNEFIDNAIELEADLHSSNTTTRTTATSTLSSLANVLHLPMVGEIIHTIANEKHPDAMLKSFYQVLSRITVTGNEGISEALPPKSPEENLEIFDASEPEPKPKPKPKPKPEPVPEPAPKPEPETVSLGKSKKPKAANGFGTLSLEGIKPKHFDFQLEEAANDLSLPVELIEEFVHDFIDQAHVETKKMLKAYEEGDLDAIQKIGHLLKGASSNLRINPLSDTLYKIQFTETSDNLDLLIKDYWAHFLSFENQINVISN